MCLDDLEAEVEELGETSDLQPAKEAEEQAEAAEHVSLPTRSWC